MYLSFIINFLTDLVASSCALVLKCLPRAFFLALKFKGILRGFFFLTINMNQTSAGYISNQFSNTAVTWLM